jgi:hypothetical protein
MFNILPVVSSDFKASCVASVMNERVRSICRLILTGKKRSTGRKTCPSATSATRNLIWTDLGSNPGLRAFIFVQIHILLVPLLSSDFCAALRGVGDRVMNGYGIVLTGGGEQKYSEKKRRGREMSTLRMRGAITPFPPMPSFTTQGQVWSAVCVR